MAADGIILEQTVLGHALNDTACFQLFVSEVDWVQFSSPNHKVLAYCLKQMSAMGIRQPDEDTFQLVVNGYPGEEDKDYGGAEYLRSLQVAFLEPTDNYQLIIERLKLQAAKVKVGGESLQQLAKLCNNPTSTIQELRTMVNDLAQDVETANTSGFQFKDAEQLSDEYVTNLEERQHLQFATTGFPDLDEHLAEGFAPKQITVMAGFTGMAKSTVAINMAHRIAVQGTTTALFSMESTSMSMMDKVIATLTQIPLRKLKKDVAQLNESDHANIVTALADLRKLPILINDQASVTVDGMLYQLQAAKRRGYDPKVIFIDLFGKLEDVDAGDNIAARVQKEMKRMRVLAKMLDVHFVCIVQVGRQGFGRQTGGRIKRPTLIDIKNSNAYAEEANLVILLHRNKYYLPDLEVDILEYDIAKQRDGEANIKVYFELFPEVSTIMATDRVPHDVMGDEEEPAEEGNGDRR